MSELKEKWQQENLEKTKKVLTEHFKRKKEEEMFKKMLRETLLFSALPLAHFGTDWNIDDSEFDDFNDDFKKGIAKINDDFIWEDLTDSNNKREKKRKWLK